MRGKLGAAFFALNAADAALTLRITELGADLEANPLMRPLLEWSPWAFVAVKLAVGSLGWWLIPRLPERVRWGGWALCGAYSLVVLTTGYTLLAR